MTTDDTRGTDGGDPDAEQRPRDGPDGDGGTADSPGAVEAGLMIAGAVATLVVLAYLGYHVVAVAPSGPPRAAVVGTSTLDDGRVAVQIRLSVPPDDGFVSAVVASSCTDPPSRTSFADLPEGSSWPGQIVCPAGTTGPTVAVTSWVEA